MFFMLPRSCEKMTEPYQIISDYLFRYWNIWLPPGAVQFLAYAWSLAGLWILARLLTAWDDSHVSER